MLVKIQLNKTQLDALTQFIASKENIVAPPEGFKFIGDHRAYYGGGVIPVASIRSVGNHVTWFSVTIEVKELVPMLEEHETVFQPLDEKTQYVFSIDILAKLFAVINRFPSEATVIHPWEKAKHEILRWVGR